MISLLLIIVQISAEKESICSRAVVDFLWRLLRKQILCEGRLGGFPHIQLVVLLTGCVSFMAHVLFPLIVFPAFSPWFVSSIRRESCHLILWYLPSPRKGVLNEVDAIMLMTIGHLFRQDYESSSRRWDLPRAEYRIPLSLLLSNSGSYRELNNVMLRDE